MSCRKCGCVPIPGEDICPECFVKEVEDPDYLDPFFRQMIEEQADKRRVSKSFERQDKKE